METITRKEFAKLDTRQRWIVGKTINNVLWCCNNCLSVIYENEFPETTWGAIHCDECNAELTRRTGGGQSDPFNYTFFKTIKERDEEKVNRKKELFYKLKRELGL